MATRKGDDDSLMLTKRMSIDEKIGQMSQIEIAMLVKGNKTTGVTLDMDAVEKWIGERGIGSVLNYISDDYWTAEQYRQAAIQIQTVARKYNRPPVIWGMDSIHGANYIYGAIVAPQPINIAATFNETVAYQAGRLASRDTRAAGINWLFSPLLGLALMPRWSRTFETFGEDPLLVGKMAAAMIRGIQDPDLNPSDAVPSRAAACAKHYLGYSMPRNGHDRSPSWIPTRHLYQYFVPPWKRAIQEAKVMTVMESFTETDGVPMVANPHALQYLLRERLGFGGVVVTDYEEVRNLHQWHHTAENYTAAVQQCLRRSSVDMNMIPYEYDEFHESIMSGLQSRHLTEERITESAERVMRLKHDLGMMTETLEMQDPNLALVGTDEALGMDMVRQSIVLVKNENGILPLASSETHERRLKVLVTGPTANNRVFQSGAWTQRWQGVPLEEENKAWPYGSSLVAAFSPESSLDISYCCGIDILGNDCSAKDEDDANSVSKAAQAASLADVVVIAVGEEATTEKQGDIRSLDLVAGQYDFVRQIEENTDAKIVLVYFGGRPRLLHDMVNHADAIFIGFLPGPYAGEAIVDMIMGRVNPSGRLPITYPLYDDGGGAPYFHTLSDKCTRGEGPLPHWEFARCDVQWPFGHGLSYTTFEYIGFEASGGIDQDLEVAVTVRNTGSIAGSETVMFFTYDKFRMTTPEYRRLRAFEKVFLEPGSEIRVHKRIPIVELRFVGPDDDTHYILDAKMKSWVGAGVSTDCRIEPRDNPLCIHLQSENPSRIYSGACEEACNLWNNSGCTTFFDLSEEKCLHMCLAITHYPVIEANEGWGWNYVRCLEHVVHGLHGDEMECKKMTALCRDIFRTGELNEHGSGPLDETGREYSMLMQRTRKLFVEYTPFVAPVIGAVFIALFLKGLRPNPRNYKKSE